VAIFILKDAYCSVAGTDLSSYVSSITLDFAVDPIPVDAMGSNGHLFTSGLQNNSVSITFNQDFAVSPSNKVAAVLDGQIGLGTTTIVVKATSSATSTTNPAYTISNAFLAGTQPVNGSVGDLAQMSVTFQGGTIAKTTS
jgi:hypothetical protein